MTEALFALGLLLTTASQLRLSGLPFGAGEVCLLLWLGVMGGRCLLRPHLFIGPALSRLLFFWALFAMALSLGTITGFALDEKFDPAWFLHDTFAYPLLAASSCLSVIEPGAIPRLRRVSWLLVLLSGVSLSLLVVGGYGVVPLPFDPWYWERFRGWSQNPNQLALFCTIVALTCLHLADTTRGAMRRVLALLCMTVTVIAGKLTQSDTFTFAMLVSVPLFFLVKLRSWMTLQGPRAAIAILAAMAMPLLAVSLVPVTISASALDTTEIVDALAKDGGREAHREADLRMSLWAQAFHRGLNTGMMGLGPGPHLSIPPEIVTARNDEFQPGNTAHPQQSGAANFEAHNTFLDIFTQGGALGLGALLWLMGWAVRRSYAIRSAGLVALMCGLGLSCMTGNIIRLPVVWFGLALCLVADRPADSPLVLRGAR